MTALVLADAQLQAVGRLLRRFHDATEGCDLATGCEVVCHNDFGPWNLVWVDDAPVAIIDFDNAAPGQRSDDVGYAAWKHLNLGLVPVAPDEQRRRLEVMASAYGAPADEALLAAIDRAQERMQRLLETVDPSPASPARRQLAFERAWFAANRRRLVGGAAA